MQELSSSTSRLLLASAREIIRRRLGGDPTPFVFAPDPIFETNAGCFVSLHNSRTHLLRGCIGNMDAAKPVAHSLLSAATSVLNDPRFVDDPVTLHELPELIVEITLLGPLQRVASPLDFDPPSQGIYLTLAGRSGCFLPQVARETGWTREQLLEKLCTEKLGLPANAWKNPAAVLSVFSAVVLEEKFVDGGT